MKSRNRLKETYDFKIFKSSFAYLLISYIIISRLNRIDIHNQIVKFIRREIVDKYHYIYNFNIFSMVVKSSITAVLYSNFRCSTESILVIISHIIFNYVSSSKHAIKGKKTYLYTV